MTGVAKDLAKKLVGTVGASIKAFILSKIGYVEGAGYGNQSKKRISALYDVHLTAHRHLHIRSYPQILL